MVERFSGGDEAAFESEPARKASVAFERNIDDCERTEECVGGGVKNDGTDGWVCQNG